MKWSGALRNGNQSAFHVDQALDKNVGGLGSVPVLLVEM